MKIIFIFLFLIVGGVVLYQWGSRQPPLQGMILNSQGEGVLASRAKPLVIFEPASTFRLKSYGYKTVKAQDQRQSGESVRLNLAIYEDDKQAQLITALAEASRDFEWEAAHHCPYPTLLQIEEPYDKERIYKSFFILEAKADPFALYPKVLVARSKFLLFFRRMQVIMEYREPISKEQARVIDLDPSYLNAFRSRALQSCEVTFANQGFDLDHLEKLAPAGDFSRSKLSKWLGEVQPRAAGR
ncbi:MAG: DUF4851 domain-containing protein [Desulfovibrionaceae bacterium]|nr:DUF4851 domain-containing protein [Desulfovibrionaceae bacterium]